MFCPECQAEYRQGFTHCVDCDVDLVYELPSQAPQDEGPTRTIWTGNSALECTALCRLLQNAEIQYKTLQRTASLYLKMEIPHEFEVLVPASSYDEAKQVLDLIDDDSQIGQQLQQNDEPFFDLPADDGAATDGKIRSDAYLKPWYPEDAIVEVWSQQGDDISSSIQMALKENLIHCRLDLDSGVCKILVMAEDELRAREIVREIIEGAPRR